MAITFIEEKKKQKRLMFVLIAVVLITVFVLGQEVVKRSRLKIEESEGVTLTFKKVEIDFTVLENPILKELQPFEAILPFEGSAGRQNPFVPY